MSSDPRSDEIIGGAFAEAAGTGRKQRPRVVREVEAIVFGVGDTLKDMLRAGQDESRRAQNEAWHRYDQLTKHRRDLERDEDD